MVSAPESNIHFYRWPRIRSKGGTRAAYVRYLKAHFPDLCSAVGAETFYERYRNAAVHEFSLKAGYAIGRDSGLKGAYTDTQLISDTGETITLLNIDRLVSDFLSHVEGLLARAKTRKAP